MKHAKGPRVCLLCHLHVGPEEHVAAAFDGELREQQPPFVPYENYLCQKAICYFCNILPSPIVVLLHRDCELYRRKFFPDTKLQLADVLKLWPRLPRTVAVSARHRCILAQNPFNAFKSQFNELVKFSQRICEKDREDDADKDVMRTRQFFKRMAKLPVEIILQIAESSYSHALQQPAVILMEGRFMENYVKLGQNGNTHCVNYTGGDVSVQHLYLYGTRYVASLDFTARETDYRQLLQPIAITRNEVGVTEINFNGKFTQLRPGYWYKVIRPEAWGAVMLVQIEYIVTDISLARDDRKYDDEVYWDRPCATPPNVPTWFLIEHGTCLPMLMKYVNLEDSPRGITVSCTTRGTVSIHAHKHGDCPDFYKETEDAASRSLVWIYFPLAETETITTGWVREVATTVPDRQPALVLHTSLRRTCVFGPHVPRNERHQYRFHVLSTNSLSPHGICYNNMGMESTSHFKLGFSHAVHGFNDGIVSEPFLEDTNTIPYSPIPQWFRSSASLVGVLRVRLCVDQQKSHIPCIGMLLIYEDREISLGQWRFDKTIEDIDFLGSLCLFVGQATNGPYVRIMDSRKQGGKGWRKLTETVRITWWFTSECSILEV